MKDPFYFYAITHTMLVGLKKWVTEVGKEKKTSIAAAKEREISLSGGLKFCAGLRKIIIQYADNERNF